MSLSDTALLELVMAYDAAHPDADQVVNVMEYFDRTELVNMLQGAKGRTIQFDIKYGGEETMFAPKSIRYTYA